MLGFSNELFGSKLHEAAKVLLTQTLPSTITMESVKRKCKGVHNKISVCFNTSRDCSMFVNCFKQSEGNATIVIDSAPYVVKVRHDQPYQVRKMKWMLSVTWKKLSALFGEKPVLSVDSRKGRLMMEAHGVAIAVLDIQCAIDDDADIKAVAYAKFLECGLLRAPKIEQLIIDIDATICLATQ